MSRVALSRVLHGHAAISVDLARRLEAWLRKPDGRGPSAETWLRGQVNYDLWQAEHSGSEVTVEPAHAALA